MGPYKIFNWVGKVTYEFMLPRELDRVHQVFYICILMQYIGDSECILPLEGFPVGILYPCDSAWEKWAELHTLVLKSRN